MIDMTDRLGISIGPHAFYFIKSEFRAGRNHQKIIVEHAPIAQFDLITLGMKALRAAAIECDALTFQIGRYIEFDRVACPRIDGNPGV